MKFKKIILPLIPIVSLSSLNARATETLNPVCKSLINYAAQLLDTQFTDGSFADKNDPDALSLKKDFQSYTVSKLRLFDCDGKSVPEPWCAVAGGSPGVYRVEVSKVRPSNNGKKLPNQKLGTVTVTYNRGGCRIDQIERN